MFVSEGCIVGSCCVRVNVSSLEGVSVRLLVDVDLCVDALKIDAVSQLYESSECSKLSLYYNLLHVRTGRLISGELTLRQVQVEDDGMWCIIIVINKQERQLYSPCARTVNCAQ